jgi:hypothetical protein
MEIMTTPPLDQSRTSMRSFSSPRRCSKFTLTPIKNILRQRLLRLPDKELEVIADKTWQIAPGFMSISRPAFFLPNQLERVTGTAYTPNHEREMIGGHETYQPPTRGFLVKNAWLVDGSIHKGHEKKYLFPRTSRWPQVSVENEIDRGAIYCSGDGLEFFGRWLTEDCVAYPLAMNEGIPITADRIPYVHALDYEALLGMKPVRLRNAFLTELVFFADTGETQHKCARFRAQREKILARFPVKAHPGVFILRRSAGKKRILYNELDLAEHLRERRGFRILDITTADVATIVSTCAGAQAIVGVEGSNLLHGVLTLQPGGGVLVLQPPDRFTGVIKRTTDHHDQHFGFVVGHAEDGGFRIDPSELERTLDLLPASPPLSQR